MTVTEIVKTVILRRVKTLDAKVIQLGEYQDFDEFDPYDDPCSRCNPVIKKGCATTCKEAKQFWIKVANLIGYSKEEIKIMSLSHYSDDTLQKELNRRKENQDLNDKPVANEEIPTEEIKTLCLKHIDEIENGEIDRGTEHYIYEAAMEAVFGKDVWQWVNRNLK